MKILLVIIGVIILALVGAEVANAWWQVTAGRCEGHSVGELWSYGGNVYWCGWTQTGYYTFVWR